MYSHQMVGSNDIARSKIFYDALFAALGGTPGVIDAKGRIVYAHNGGRFLVTRPINGEAATHSNGGTIGFIMESPEQADAWHAAGVANGGTTCEDPPGIRQATEGRTLYLAYLRDPDGNKLCGLHRIES
ncbi:catechol 2,3-dioxygenase-like lactoylglutathione lyase family enzyme [Sphingobium xanthum]|jgi:catechol 2,3-dioxygenase-like lactoylglutathione lyase family enzyme|uniref:VOC family protein n=1 Tax=Sphingobium xanthum TaxID=1387165 RepID=UPI001C8B6C64|nr:VOC family protein [Sphingobium xanthum]